MSPVERMVCLAVSRKHYQRCIAGIDLKTGRWVRPVTDTASGAVSEDMMRIDGRLPAICEIIEIPLSDSGPDFGFQFENRLILPGAWRRVGRMKPGDMVWYCCKDSHILHTQTRYVSKELLLAPGPWKATLQLWETNDLVCNLKDKRASENPRWKASFSNCHGSRVEAVVTDTYWEDRLKRGRCPRRHCLVTMSLGLPWVPEGWQGPPDPCWKLAASIVEL